MGRKNLTGKRIAEARKTSNPFITQLDLVARMQTLGIPMDQSKLSKIESCDRAVTDIELKGFAEALHVSVEWLLEASER